MGHDNFILALKDFDQLLTLEPNNAIARTERTKTAVLTREYEKIKKTESASGFLVSGPGSGPGSGIKSSGSFAEIPKTNKNTENTSGSGSGTGSGTSGVKMGGVVMEERSSRRIQSPLPIPDVTVNAAVTGNVVETTSILPPTPPSSALEVSSSLLPSLPSPTSSTSTSTSPTVSKPLLSQNTQNTQNIQNIQNNQNKSSKREPIIPSEIPKTLYELERAWRGLKDRPDLFAKYITQNIQKKSVIKKVFKEAISPELLSSVFVSLRDYCEVDVILTVLGGLSVVNHFNMTLALFPEEDIKCLKLIFIKCMDNIEISESRKESLQQLREAYKM